MTDRKPTTAGPESATEVELELHTSVEALQTEVRALATAVDHLCRAVEAVAGAESSTDVTQALEEARLSLGEVW